MFIILTNTFWICQRFYICFFINVGIARKPTRNTVNTTIMLVCDVNTNLHIYVLFRLSLHLFIYKHLVVFHLIKICSPFVFCNVSVYIITHNLHNTVLTCIALLCCNLNLCFLIALKKIYTEYLKFCIIMII